MDTLSRGNSGDQEGHGAPREGAEAVGRTWLRPLLDGARPGAGARGRAARLGREVGQEVSGLSRRGPGLRDLGRESEMGEDPADHTRILNGREQAHAAARWFSAARSWSQSSPGRARADGPGLAPGLARDLVGYQKEGHNQRCHSAQPNSPLDRLVIGGVSYLPTMGVGWGMVIAARLG